MTHLPLEGKITTFKSLAISTIVYLVLPLSLKYYWRTESNPEKCSHIKNVKLNTVHFVMITKMVGLKKGCPVEMFLNSQIVYLISIMTGK